MSTNGWFQNYSGEWLKEEMGDVLDRFAEDYVNSNQISEEFEARIDRYLAARPELIPAILRMAS